jgi:acetate kinase
MLVFVINCGSSSIKYQLFDMPEKRVLARGVLERIGEAGSAVLTHRAGDGKWNFEVNAPDHRAGLDFILRTLTTGETGVIRDLSEIKAVGHRVVHGGESIREAVVIDADVEAVIARCAELAPVHNPPNLMGIRTARDVLPACVQVAVFDTAFHHTLPKKAYLYALPLELYEQHGIRKYGFHGTSHEYVAVEAAARLGRPLSECNLITCHLGNGCSMTAIEGGRSVDTSMGMTPLQGLMMGTRSGDLDPAVLVHLLRNGWVADAAELDRLLNRKSGLAGISGIGNDMRTLEEHMDANPRALLAVEMFCHRVRFYLGGYLALLGTCDAIVFTGGIGENDHIARAVVLSGLEALGITLDAEVNEATIRGRTGAITTPDSRIPAFVIPTDEEGMIASSTYDLAK